MVERGFLPSKQIVSGPLLLALLIVWSSDLLAQPPSQPATKGATAEQIKVDRLITQLGDSQYANRVRAQEELKQLGLAAFDALHRAQGLRECLHQPTPPGRARLFDDNNAQPTVNHGTPR